MAVAPYPIQCKRDNKWVTIQTDELMPGDVVSIGELISKSLWWYTQQLLSSWTN